MDTRAATKCLTIKCRRRRQPTKLVVRRYHQAEKEVRRRLATFERIATSATVPAVTATWFVATNANAATTSPVSFLQSENRPKLQVTVGIALTVILQTETPIGIWINLKIVIQLLTDLESCKFKSNNLG